MRATILALLLAGCAGPYQLVYRGGHGVGTEDLGQCNAAAMMLPPTGNAFIDAMRHEKYVNECMAGKGYTVTKEAL